MYEYKAIIKKVYDGDTVIIDIDLGFHIWIRDQSVRVEGINTPEIRTKNLLEKEVGYLVRDYVGNILKVDEEVVFLSKEIEGKFGRLLGDFQINNKKLTDVLLEKQFALPYFGGKKQMFTEEFLQRIKNEIDI